MIQYIWESTPRQFPHVELGAFIVMPNHFHGVIIIHEDVEAALVAARDLKRASSTQAGTSPAATLSEIIGAFKSRTTFEYIRGVEQYGWKRFNRHLWQRSFYDHILRDQTDWERIHAYIEANPSNWGIDEENPNQ
jgi:putative transposase